MCNFCDGYYVKEYVHNNSKAERRKYKGAWMRLEKVHKIDRFGDDRGWIENGILHVDAETEYDGVMYDTSIEVEINFCPFCGKKLR